MVECLMVATVWVLVDMVAMVITAATIIITTVEEITIGTVDNTVEEDMVDTVGITTITAMDTINSRTTTIIMAAIATERDNSSVS